LTMPPWKYISIRRMTCSAVIMSMQRGRPSSTSTQRLAGLSRLIAISQWQGSIFPAAPAGAAAQCAVVVQELVIGIGFPVGGLTATGDDDTRTVGGPGAPILDRGGEMHEGGDAAKHALGVVNEANQLPQAGLAAQVNDAVQAGMVVSVLADLDKLNAAAKMVYDLLVAFRLPPFDGQVVLSSRANDPKRGVFPGNFMNL